MTEKQKQSGYQPIKTSIENPTPPNTGSHVQMKKDGYTWEDMDNAWWEGFDCCKEKLEKKNEELDFKRKAERKIFQGKVVELLEENKQAKEIIKRLVNTCCSYGATGKVTAEAEAFIKEY